MDRSSALRILGLPASASDEEMRAAWWVLRAHVEARLVQADDANRATREHELVEIERIGEAFGLTAPAPRSLLERLPAGPIAAAAALVFALVAWWVVSGGAPPVLVGGPGGGTGGAGGYAIEGASDAGDGEADVEVVAREERARVVADAGIAGATLEIVDAGSQEAVASGAADETVYWLEPGSYELRVSHPDCGAPWAMPLEAEAGAEHDVEPEICRETGWLVVQANVEGARVEIDGEAVGATGPARHPAPVGEREVRVTKPGFAPWEGIVELSPGQELALEPRLGRPPAQEQEAASAKAPGGVPPATAASGAPGRPGDGLEDEHDPELDEGWHHETRQWLLSRYDTDRSGAIDRREELDAIPCDYWKSIERSFDASRLGLSLVRAYGFDGEGWKPGALGVDTRVRDLAYQRMRECGLNS